MPFTFGMTSENLSVTQASVRDRLASIVTKLKELEGIAQRLPQDDRGMGAMFAHQLSRAQQFAFRLLKDVEAAATTPHKDANP